MRPFTRPGAKLFGLIGVLAIASCTGEVIDDAADDAEGSQGGAGGHSQQDKRDDGQGGGEPDLNGDGDNTGGTEMPLPDGAAPLNMAPRDPAAQAARCDLTLTEVAAYQTLKIPLWRGGSFLPMRNAELIQRRTTLFRFAVTPGPMWNARAARGRLHLTRGAATETIDDDATISAASSDGNANSTFNFVVPADRFDDTTAVAFEILAGDDCTSAPALARRAPASGTAPLRAIRSGTLKVVLVPLRYEADQSNRLPDTSNAQIARYKGLLESMFPIEASDVTVREAVGLKTALSASGNWGQVLDGMRGLRAQDAPPPDTYYMGLVVPAATAQAYCAGQCVAGIAYHNDRNMASLQVGLSLGFTGDQSARAVVHEIGHEHGLGHAPCQAAEGLDRAYPYQNASTGVWGFDARRMQIFDPGRYKDFMGYCEPTWISDYSYGKLFTRVRAVSAPQTFALRVGPASSMRALIVSSEGAVTWGQPWTESVPAGAPEIATVEDQTGAIVTRPTVYRTTVGDGGDAMVLVPAPEPGWHRVLVAGARPITFASPPVVSPLAP